MTASGRLPTWGHIGILSLVILIALFLFAQTAHAVLPEPCGSDEPCELLGVHLSPNASLLAADSEFVYAQLGSVGDAPPQAAVFQALEAGYVLTGGLPLDAVTSSRVVLQGDFLFVATGENGIATISVANPARPTITHFVSLPDSIEWIVGAPGAIYALTARQINANTVWHDLHVLSLGPGGEPAVVAMVPAIDGSRPQISGNLMAMVNSSSVSLYTLDNPLAPSVAATLTVVFTDTVAPPQDALLAGNHLYLLRSDAGGTFHCRIADVSAPAAPVLGDRCPFLPFRTTFAGSFAYVNPNRGASEYQDYLIYSLADPARPVAAGAAPQRWTQLLPAGNAFVASARTETGSVGGFVRYVQNADGSLREVGRSWRASDYADDGTIALVDGDYLYLDRGASPQGRRVRILDIGVPAAPRIAGEIVSPLINPNAMLSAGNLLASRTGSRITLFDITNPAAVNRLGSISPPAGETFVGMTFGDAGRLLAATEHNYLISVDVSQPFTPTQTAQIDLPGTFRHLVHTGGHIYLFEESTLTIVDARDGRLEFVKSVPVEDGITDVRAWDSQVFVFRFSQQSLEILDATHPASPIDRPFDAGMDETATLQKLAAAGDGRLALLFSIKDPAVEESAPDATVSEYSLRIYSLESAGPTLQSALAGLVEDDLVTDGRTIVVDGMQIVRPSAWQVRSAQRVPEDTFRPRPGITYTLVGPPPVGDYCLVHTEPVQSALPDDLTHGFIAGIYDVKLRSCGAGVSPGYPYTVTVAVDTSQADAAIFLDRGDHWQAALGPQQQAAGAQKTATLQAPARWGVLGPPWPPVRLPVVLVAK